MRWRPDHLFGASATRTKDTGLAEPIGGSGRRARTEGPRWNVRSARGKS
jgi:hypothetical protein